MNNENLKKVIKIGFATFIIMSIIAFVVNLIGSQNQEIKNLKVENETLNSRIDDYEKEKTQISNNDLKIENLVFTDENPISVNVTEVKKTEKKTTKKKEKTYKLPSKSSFKSYTNYHCLNRKSPQWKMQKKAYTDKNGLRKIDDDYLVAMGSYYSKTLGDRFEITLSSGNKFTIRICDFKANKDTNKTNQYTTANGCAIEFYVDDNLNKNIRKMGTVSALKKFKGKITKIEKL